MKQLCQANMKHTFLLGVVIVGVVLGVTTLYLDVLDLRCVVSGKSRVKVDRALTFDTYKASLDRQMIDSLADSLSQHLAEAGPSHNKSYRFRSCHQRHIKNYDGDNCDNKTDCLNVELPSDLRERIQSVIHPPNMAAPTPHYRRVLDEMRNQFRSKQEVIIASALSSNHFGEAQAMLENFHQNVFPTLKNFTLLIYDLGLTDHEREQLEKHCRCQVRTFPFYALPDYFATLRCFAWKVFIIAAHLPQAEVLIWADASIRIFNKNALPVMIERTKQRGVQQRCSSIMKKIPYHTVPQMFEAWNDSPCIYLPFRMVEGGFGIFHNEPLIEKAVVGGWLTCACNAHCICPVHQEDVQKCPQFRTTSKIGWCNRVDQSALSVVLAKLFQEKYNHFAVQTSWFQSIDRGDYPYFDQLEGKVKEADAKKAASAMQAASAIQSGNALQAGGAMEEGGFVEAEEDMDSGDVMEAGDSIKAGDAI